MASTYTGLGTELMTTGENASTWGTKTNTNLKIIEQFAGGYIEQAVTTTTTLSVSDGAVDATLAHRIIKFTGTISANATVTIPLDVQNLYILKNGTSGAYTVTFKYVSGSGSTAVFAATDKGTKIVYATADDGTNPNVVDTGISTNTLTGVTGDITVDSPADIILDADGADISLKDGGTLFGTLTNSSGELVIKSSSSGTTALTFSGANVTGSGTLTVGVDDTGHDVKFFGASAGAYLEWDESADELRIMGASADATTSTGKLLLATSLTDINANDVLGKVDFQAPHEAGGTDAITIAASIRAIAQATFTSSVNATDLIFYTGHSEAATEKFRFTSQGELGVGGANYGTDGQVLTSTGAGTAPAWEDASGGGVTALNNATQSELVTVGSTTTELDAEANLTFTGSALTCIGTITTGVDDTGHDIKFFGATSGSFFLWDESEDALRLTDSSPLEIGDAQDLTLYHDGTNSYITNKTGVMKIATETSGIALTIGHTTSETTIADNLVITGTTTGTTFDTGGTADAIILDANGNTTISSPTDDQIDFEIAGADDFTMTANTFTILSGSTIAIAAGGAITNAGSMAPDIVSSGKAAVFGL
jgi:hypothetical protein